MRRRLGLPLTSLRVAARALVLALALAAAGPLAHGTHEDPCDTPFIVHDAAQHHVQAASKGVALQADAEHCLACHFARSLRGQTADRAIGPVAFASGTLLYHSDGQLVAAPTFAALPARAPPHG